MANRLTPEKPGDPTYRQIWRVVDGAVATALAAHPEFIAPDRRLRTVRNSIVKRVVGAIWGYAEQSAWVRSGSSPAHDTGVTVRAVAPEAASVTASDPGPPAGPDRREGVGSPPASSGPAP